MNPPEKNTALTDILQMIGALAVIGAFFGGCATASTQYQVGPIRVTVTNQVTVDRECRAQAPNLALLAPHAQIRGCYLTAPGRAPRIYSTPDVPTVLHELRHHFEGAFHE